MLAHRLPLARRNHDAPTAADGRQGMEGTRKPGFAVSRTDHHRDERVACSGAPSSLRLVDAKTRRPGAQTRARLIPTAEANRGGLVPGPGTGAGGGAWQARRLSNGCGKGSNLRRRSANLCRNAGSPLKQSAAALG